MDEDPTYDEAELPDTGEYNSYDWELDHSPVSLKSLHIEVLDHERKRLSTGTGFIFTHIGPWDDHVGSRFSLVTNFHVVAGQRLNRTWIPPNNISRRPTYLLVRIPLALSQDATRDMLSVHEFLLELGTVGNYRRNWYSKYQLRDSPKTRVLGPEHSDFEYGVPVTDIAVIPIPSSIVKAERLADRAYVWDERSFRKSNNQVMVRPTDRVYVLGYPDSLEAFSPTMPIWTTGSVANEVNLGPKERFFIDSRTRPGQSGSPVIMYRQETHIPGNGGLGAVIPEHAELMGIYSGRTDDNSDIGSVWWGDEIESLYGAIPRDVWHEPDITI